LSKVSGGGGWAKWREGKRGDTNIGRSEKVGTTTSAKTCGPEPHFFGGALKRDYSETPKKTTRRHNPEKLFLGERKTKWEDKETLIAL